MSLDIHLVVNDGGEGTVSVYDANITHNLGQMARAAGLYMVLWRPDELGVKQAQELVSALDIGLQCLKIDPSYYQQFNPDNGWGDYDILVKFVENYLQACRDHPRAEVTAHR